jgi:hypothetical protein
MVLPDEDHPFYIYRRNNIYIITHTHTHTHKHTAGCVGAGVRANISMSVIYI